MVRAMKVFVFAALALAVASPAVADTCAKQVTAYDKWLAPIKADVAKGAVMSDRVERWVAIPLRQGSPPKQSAMTIVVDKDGLHDGDGPAVAPSGAGALIERNVNIAFARTNANAISRGILIAATPDAPASSVKAAAVAAAAAKESVWLVFRPNDGTAKAPAKSPVTDELGTRDVNALVKVISKEFGACSGLMSMMQSLGGQTESSRLRAILDKPSAALAKCKCKTKPSVVASVMWKLAFENLAVVVPVPAKSIAGLPWGDATATWADAGPVVAKAL